jgi:hypothetical protein
MADGYFEKYEEGQEGLDEYKKLRREKEKELQIIEKRGIEDLKKVVKEINYDFQRKAQDHYKQTGDGVYFVLKGGNEDRRRYNLCVKGNNGEESIAGFRLFINREDGYTFDVVHYYGNNCKSLYDLEKQVKIILGYPATASAIEKVR